MKAARVPDFIFRERVSCIAAALALLIFITGGTLATQFMGALPATLPGQLWQVAAFFVLPLAALRVLLHEFSRYELALDAYIADLDHFPLNRVADAAFDRRDQRTQRLLRAYVARHDPEGRYSGVPHRLLHP